MDEDTSQPRRVTIVDIARALNVTPATVSNAFNRPDQLSAELRARVLTLAENIGYLGPDAAARSMRRGRLRSIGVLYADRLPNAFADAAYVQFLEGLSRAAEEAGLSLSLIPGLPAENGKLEAVSGAVIDAIVIYSMADDDPLVGAAVDRRLPLVIADSPQLSGIPYVGIDDRDAARAIAGHLTGLGHQQFAVLASELQLDRVPGPASTNRQLNATFQVNRERLHGYREALIAAGLDWARVPVEEVTGDLESAARRATKRILAREPAPTAILAMSDRIALEALAEIRDAGMTVPTQISVAGFDDIPMSQWAIPPLTTVRQPHREKGLLAGRLLAAGLAGQRSNDTVILPTSIVVRGTTGVPPTR